MNDSVKKRLTEAAARKRLANPKAKDYAPDEWLIHLDKAKDELAAAGYHARTYELTAADSADHFKDNRGGVVLKYVSDEVIAALARVLPTVRVRYKAGPNRVRTTRVFPYALTTRLLRVMRLDPEKYSSVWDYKYVKQCRLKD